ncbi:Uncharacterized protein conserved in bacteria [Ralstonia mannitolilytica]|uniref:Uncharacterized protein conserved in bacteria n=2 Tax=Ralstonia mannitolilytica TaxID=105219 RepID=A0AAJ4ZQW2_9RALS|nr:hypothetical protein LMG6866_00551 [Ralstonia mannitolilytica]CAJ0737785.1 hypothetical protein R77592_04434 [Ralstonia mannitolilytica]SUE24800.1 Uncharacterized protein conserved in bacteria [Ralstonia mannitolilytica]SUE26505.1 Uncharacterized protein conserved in bacteria [Ralstonia mannitolilytica]SUE36314.1 Uncharacterized protein conserved in bacteria [Ralstonia mannitolilytica]
MGHRPALLNARTVSVTGQGLPEILGEPALVFSKLSGTERLCELFEYEIELKTPDERNVLYGPGADLDTNALRSQELTVTIALDGTDAGTREISGLVTDIVGPIPVNGGRPLKYRLTLRPWLWLATLNRDTRIFQQQTVVEILDTLLGGYIFPVERRLDIARYPKREYQVQYNESDFEFFQRLTQEWGIAWHIEHSDAGRAGGRGSVQGADASAGGKSHAGYAARRMGGEGRKTGARGKVDWLCGSNCGCWVGCLPCGR